MKVEELKDWLQKQSLIVQKIMKQNVDLALGQEQKASNSDRTFNGL